MKLRCKVVRDAGAPELFSNIAVGHVFVFKGQFDKPCLKVRSDYYYAIEDAMLLSFGSGCTQHVYLCEIVTPLAVKIVS